MDEWVTGKYQDDARPGVRLIVPANLAEVAHREGWGARQEVRNYMIR
jgi:hypothetical protein